MDFVENALDSALGSMASDMQALPSRSQYMASLLRGQPAVPQAPQTFAQGSGGAPFPGPVQQRPQPDEVPFDPMRPLQRSMAARPPQAAPVPQAAPPQQAPQMTPPVQSPPNDALVQQGQALDVQEKSLIEQMDKLAAPVDHSQAQAVYDKRVQGADRSMLMALAAQQAGPGFEPFQQFALKQAAERQAPMKVAGGEFTPEGFIADAQYVADKRMSVINAQLTRIQAAKNSNITEQSRQELKKHEDKLRQEAQQLQLGFQASMAEANRAMQAQIAGQASADRRFAAGLAHEDRQAAAAAKAAGGKGQVDPQHLVDLVGEAKSILPKATASGAGALYDKGAHFFGQTTEGSQATARLNAIGGQLVMAQPRMEGPQSDKDVALYQRMAGDVANDKLPIADRLAALDTIETVAKKYISGEFVPATRPPGAAPRAPAAAAATPAAKGGVVDYGSLK